MCFIDRVYIGRDHCSEAEMDVYEQHILNTVKSSSVSAILL